MSVLLYDEPFLSYCPILRTCPQNDLDMFKVKGVYMHTAYMPEAQIFILLSLYDEAFFELHPFSGEVHQMTPNDRDMFKVKNTSIYRK